MFIYYFIIAVIIFLDQLIKGLTTEFLALGEQWTLLPHIFSLQYIQNDGAAWGILSGKMGVFFVITALVLAFLLYTLHKEGKAEPVLALGISLMIGGAVGNFIDRLRLHYVIDMFRFDFINFPVFNFADACLTIGVLILMISMLYAEFREKRNG